MNYAVSNRCRNIIEGGNAMKRKIKQTILLLFFICSIVALPKNIYAKQEKIVFGKYPQTLDYSEMDNFLRELPLDKYNAVNYKNNRYRKCYSQYIKYIPIEWTILEHKGENVVLISDKILDRKPWNCTEELFSEGWEHITWEDSSLRKWMNNDFYNDAFTKECK